MISSLRVVRNFTPASDCGFVNSPHASDVTLVIDGQEIFTEFLGSCDIWCQKERPAPAARLQPSDANARVTMWTRLLSWKSTANGAVSPDGVTRHPIEFFPDNAALVQLRR